VYIGTHISIRHGYQAAALHAHKLNMNAYQFFPKNPRSLTIKAYDQDDAEACRRFISEYGMRAIVHTPYPVNLAAEEEALRQATVRSILNDLEICEACGALGLVVHFGKYKGVDPLQGYRLIIRSLDEVLAMWDGNTMILLENQAGEARCMGTTLEELTQIRSLTRYPEKIGFCFDTCHAYASGIWNGNNSEELIEKGKQLQYWEALRAVHLNDSMYETGSLKDRHAPLGEGKIGLENLSQLLSHAIFREIPHILETPSQKNNSHAQQITRFLRLIY
jgi:deoxyribonuclease-4